MSKIIPNCGSCKHFAKAFDPNIQKVYVGQCNKLEWPYAVNIPKEHGIEGECGYYEGPGPAFNTQG